MEQIIKFKLVTHFYYGIYNSKPKLLNALSPNIAAKWSILPLFEGQKWSKMTNFRCLYLLFFFNSIQLSLLQGEVSITISNWKSPYLSLIGLNSVSLKLPLCCQFCRCLLEKLWQDGIFLLEKTQPLSLSQGSAIFSSSLASTTTRFADVIK